MSVNSKYVKKCNKIDNFEKWGNNFSTHQVTGVLEGHAAELMVGGKVVVIIPKSKNEGLKHNYLMSYERQHFSVRELEEGKQYIGFTEFLQNAICHAVKGEFKGKKNKVKSLTCKIFKVDDERREAYALECKVKRHKVKPFGFEVLPLDDDKVIH